MVHQAYVLLTLVDLSSPLLSFLVIPFSLLPQPLSPPRPYSPDFYQEQWVAGLEKRQQVAQKKEDAEEEKIEAEELDRKIALVVWNHTKANPAYGYPYNASNLTNSSNHTNFSIPLVWNLLGVGYGPNGTRHNGTYNDTNRTQLLWNNFSNDTESWDHTRTKIQIFQEHSEYGVRL